VHKVHVLENQHFGKLPKLQKIFRNNGQKLVKKSKHFYLKWSKKNPATITLRGGTIEKQLGGAMNE
jgi:hypothetical protein